MKVLFVTDIHESRSALNWLLNSAKKSGYEALIIGGDIAVWGRSGFLNEFIDSMRRMNPPVLFVQGNHDPRYLSLPSWITPLHGGIADIDSKLTIGGLGGSNITPFGTPFEHTDGEARKILDALGYVDILLTHCPPHGTKCDLTLDGKHAGSKPVREYVEEKHPKLVLSGHVHEAKSMDNIGETVIVNPGALKDGNYATLEISGEEIKDIELQSTKFS